MKRYKAGANKKLKMENISEKSIFDLVEKHGEGVHDGFHIYTIHENEERKVYRCDTGDTGSFETIKLSGEEEYDLKTNDWIWVEGVIYRYNCLSTTYNGYPILPINEAFDLLNF